MGLFDFFNKSKNTPKVLKKIRETNTDEQTLSIESNNAKHMEALGNILPNKILSPSIDFDETIDMNDTEDKYIKRGDRTAHLMRVGDHIDSEVPYYPGRDDTNTSIPEQARPKHNPAVRIEKLSKEFDSAIPGEMDTVKKHPRNKILGISSDFDKRGIYTNTSKGDKGLIDKIIKEKRELTSNLLVRISDIHDDTVYKYPKADDDVSRLDAECRDRKDKNYKETTDMIECALNMFNMNSAQHARASGRLKAAIHDHYNLFKRFNHADDFDASEPLTAKIFVTRPDMLLYMGDNVSPTIQNKDFAQHLANNRRLYSYLDGAIKPADFAIGDGNTNFIPLFTNAFVDMNLPDLSVETEESASNSRGGSVSTVKVESTNHRNGDIQITFNNDYQANIAKMVETMVRYQRGIIDREVVPKMKNVLSNSIDYAVTIFGFLLGPDGETIHHWFEIPCVYPTSTLDSSFKYSIERSRGENLTVTFKLNLPIRYNEPSTIVRFNHLMGVRTKDHHFFESYMTTSDAVAARISYYADFYYSKRFVISGVQDKEYGDMLYHLVGLPDDFQGTVNKPKTQKEILEGYPHPEISKFKIAWWTIRDKLKSVYESIRGK